MEKDKWSPLPVGMTCKYCTFLHTFKDDDGVVYTFCEKFKREEDFNNPCCSRFLRNELSKSLHKN